jgi:hypothetical protein
MPASASCQRFSIGQPVQAGRRGEQLQRLPQAVELELADDLVARPARASRVPAQPQPPFSRNGLASDRVGGHQAGAVVQDPLGEEPDGAVEKRVRAVGGDRQPRVALVPDPGVAVVVVPPALHPLGQRGGGRGDHRAAARRQPAQDGVGVPGVPDADQVLAIRHHGGPGLLRGRPGLARTGRSAVQRAVGQFQDQIVVPALGERQGKGQPIFAGPGPCRARPAEPDRAAAPGPASAGARQAGHAAAPVGGPDVEQHADPGWAVERLDSPQDDGAVRVGRHRQRLPALRPGPAHPAAAPDEGPALVVPAPHVPGVGWGDRVAALAAEQPAEDRGAVPARCAQPRDRPVRADQRTALAVGDQRVLAQDVRPEGTGHGRSYCPEDRARNAPGHDPPPPERCRPAGHGLA